MTLSQPPDVERSRPRELASAPPVVRDLVAARCLFVASDRGEHGTRATVLANGLAGRGARVEVLRTTGRGKAEIAEAITRFCPSFVFVCGVPEAARLARRVEIPTLWVASMWDDGMSASLTDTAPLRAMLGSRTVVLLTDPPGCATAARPAQCIEVGPIFTSRPAAVRTTPTLAVTRAAARAIDRDELRDVGVVEIASPEDAPAGCSAVVVSADEGAYAGLPIGVPTIAIVPSSDVARSGLWRRMETLGLGGCVEEGPGAGARIVALGRSLRASEVALLRELVDDAGASPIAIAAELVLATLDQLREPVSHLPPPVPALAIERDPFVDYLLASGPPLERAQVEVMLEQAEALGIPRWSTPSGVVFDRFRSWTWLFTRSPAFFEAEARARRTTRARGCLRDGDRDNGRCCLGADRGPRQRVLTRPQRYRVAVRYAIDVDDLDAGTPVRVYLPYPIVTDAQRDVSLVDCEPGSLRGALVPELGFVYGAELAKSHHTIHVGYRAELTVSEIHAHGFGVRREVGADRRPIPELIPAIAAHPDPFVRASLLHSAMVESARFEKVFTPCICGPCSRRLVEERGVGHCIVFTEALLGYLERVGVQARPVRGCLFTYPRGGDRFGIDSIGEPIIGHTWAELEIPGVGWLPAEFEATAVRGTPHNLVDDEVRRSTERDFRFLQAFHFGNLDNQRIVFSRSCLDIPVATFFHRGHPQGSRWQPIPWARVRTSFEVEYL